MAPWAKALLIICTAIIFLGLLSYIYILKRSHRAEASRWKRIADQKYKEGRNEASQILRAAVDQISDDKARFAALSDRELITEGLLALAGHSRRMARMEDSLRSFSQFEDIMASVEEQSHALSQNASLLTQQMTQAQDAASAFQSAVSGTNEAVYSLSDSTHSMESLLQDVTEQIGAVREISGQFSQLQDQMDGVVRRINRTLTASKDNPAAAIGQMEGRISDFSQQLQNLSEGLNLLAQSLEGVQETLDRVSLDTRKIQAQLSHPQNPADR